MNLESPAIVSLDPPADITGAETTGFAVPEPTATSEVPEASIWSLLIVAAAVWLLRLRKRQSRRPGTR